MYVCIYVSMYVYVYIYMFLSICAQLIKPNEMKAMNSKERKRKERCTGRPKGRK